MEDLVSISLASVNTAIDKIKENKKRTFYSYWERIATNAMKRFVKMSMKQNKGDTGVSLDDETEFGGSLHDSIASEDYDKEISIYNSLITIINDERCKLTAKEKAVISLSLDGYDMVEISKIMKINKTSAYRHYHNAINKIRRSLIDKK